MGIILRPETLSDKQKKKLLKNSKNKNMRIQVNSLNGPSLRISKIRSMLHIFIMLES